jgi:hypothetical protein
MSKIKSRSMTQGSLALTRNPAPNPLHNLNPTLHLSLHGSGRQWALVGLALVSIGFCGCANAWDQITRHDIPFDARVKLMFASPPDPLVVLRDSKDGDQRAKALRSLREPKQHGGSDKDQELVLSILVTSAKSDSQPVCRLAAIGSLGKFKDEHAVQALIDAYYQATVFAPETATMIQCEALTALGQTKNPAAVDLLTRVVRAPEPALDVSDQDKQQERDRRIAAARALGNFSHYQATEALVQVLRTNKDVALRDRAHESLVKATGKDLPADPKPWEEMLEQQVANGNKPPAPDSKINLLGWFQRN